MKRIASFNTSVLLDAHQAASLPPNVADAFVAASVPSTQQQRTLEKHVRALQRQVAQIHARVAAFEEINARWGLRYTRRFALAGNLFVGGWIFLYRLLGFLRQRRAQLLQAMMPKISLRGPVAGPAPATLVSSAITHSLRGGAWVFFVCALLLTRNRSWNRLAGATFATTYAAYLSLMGLTRKWPWTLFFSVAGNLSYLVATFNSHHSQAPTLPAYGAASPEDEEEML